MSPPRDESGFVSKKPRDWRLGYFLLRADPLEYIDPRWAYASFITRCGISGAETKDETREESTLS